MESSTDSAATKLFLTLEFNQVRLTDKIPISELAWPDNNFSATLILARLLDAILKSAGELVSPTLFSGPLNHSFYTCDVRDGYAAAKTIWRVLGEISLTRGVKIFCLCNAEDLLMCLYPEAGDAASLDDLMRKLLTADNLTETGKARSAEVTRLIAGLQQTKKPGGDSKQ
jgi:hypothetical protein